MDDYGPYMEAWIANRARGLGIMPAATCIDHPRVIPYSHDTIDLVRRGLQAAYDREPGGPLGFQINPNRKRATADSCLTHCCKEHGCKYGYNDCPVEYGSDAGVPCEVCDMAEQL